MHYPALLLSSLLLLLLARKLTNYLLSLQKWKRFGTHSPLPSVTIYTYRDAISIWLTAPLIYPLMQRLPFNLGLWYRYIARDNSWRWKEESWPKELLGEAWWCVGPGGAQLWISDPVVNWQVVLRRNEFVKKVEDYATLNVFGGNVVSSEGVAWQRHRKITGPPFNEGNSCLVFEQTIRQGKGMLASLTQNADGRKSEPGQEPVVEDLVKWTMMITLNVISGAALNIKALWPTHSVAAPTEETAYSREEKSVDVTTQGLPFQKSFDSVMNNVRWLVACPPTLLRYNPFKAMRSMQHASEDFRTYMYELISSHKSKVESGLEDQEHSGDLLGSIVRGSTGSKSVTLSEEEMIGNIFVFVLAGHETTGTTLQTALLLLACYPGIQGEVQGEIDEIWKGKREGEELVYEDYGAMRKIMAVMLETLRLYPPVVMLPKFSVQDTTLTINNMEIPIPADTRVSIDIVSTQRNPRYWPNPHAFLPSRWLMPSNYIAPPETNNESAAHVHLLCPPKGAFIAFASGFRGCLGRKFAQVEFCTVLAVLLRDHSVELVQEGRESWEEARGKALRGLDDRTTGLAMRMNGKVKVRFVRRGVECFPRRE